MTKLRILNIIGVIFLLTGCFGNFSRSSTKITSTPPKSTLTSTISSTIPPEAHLKFECLEVKRNLPSSLDVRGTIIFVKNDNPKQAYLWSMETGERQQIPIKDNEILSDFASSPDNEWLVYIRSIIDGITTVSSYLELISADGKLNKSIPIEINITTLSRWLDNQRIILRAGFEPTSTQIVLNPFTKQRQELLLDIPDIYNNSLSLDWNNQGIIVFDPTITRAVYAGLPADLVLIDLTNNVVLARISPVPIAHSVPEWSPDGEQFVFTNADITDPEKLQFELYSISKNGQVNQLTNLAAYYESIFILSYIWSPDGRYIAFWLEEDHHDQIGIVRLAVLDTVTLEVTNYCLNSIYKGYNAPPPLFWSPDSKNLIIEVIDQNDNDMSRLILVNIAQGSATQIAENITPVGWLKAH